jgi:hypothetical protein
LLLAQRLALVRLVHRIWMLLELAHQKRMLELALVPPALESQMQTQQALVPPALESQMRMQQALEHQMWTQQVLVLPALEHQMRTQQVLHEVLGTQQMDCYCLKSLENSITWLRRIRKASKQL